MALNPEMRAADSDRDRVAEALREHCAQGRITMDELRERLDATYAAKTLGDLEAVTADLPEHDLYDWPIPASRRSAAVTSMPSGVPGRRPGGAVQRRGMVGAWATYAGVNLICATIWLVAAVTGAGLQGLWPLWVAGPWGAFMLLATLNGSRRRDA